MFSEIKFIWPSIIFIANFLLYVFYLNFYKRKPFLYVSFRLIAILFLSFHIVGHGRSEGLRCFVSTAAEYVDDVLKHVAMLREEYPHLPCYIVGHSMVSAVRVAMLREEYHQLPCYIVGHSMVSAVRVAMLRKQYPHLSCYIVGHPTVSAVCSRVTTAFLPDLTYTSCMFLLDNFCINRVNRNPLPLTSAAVSA